MLETELASVDPLEMNLIVAKGIPELADLDVPRYQAEADRWADEISERLPQDEVFFWQSPADWKNDVNFFRLGVLCWYVDEVLGIRYHEDQKYVQGIAYSNPCDLFLNGVMDTRRGTCGNMAALHVALAWRLGWPLYLACAGYHILARYDDGKVTHNIEATNNGKGGFHSHPDRFYQERYSFPGSGMTSGNRMYAGQGRYLHVDLTALKPREALGVFVGLRARHYSDIGLLDEARAHYRLANRLCPRSSLFAEKVRPSEEWHPGWAYGWREERKEPWRSLNVTESFINEVCFVEGVWL
jgi:hypothetical protein